MSTFVLACYIATESHILTISYQLTGLITFVLY